MLAISSSPFACFHNELENEKGLGDGIGDVRPCDDHRQEILMVHMWLLRLAIHNAS